MNIKKLTQKDRYGNMVSFEFDVPPMESIPHPGMPIGTDTVPAWLTPGERVMNAEAERMYGPVLKQMNDDGRALQRSQGGTIPEYAACGSKVKYKYQGGPVYAADGIPVTQGEGFIPFDQMPGFAHIRSPEAEGFRPDVYDDPIKGSAVPTVGYGHKLLPEEIEAVRKGKKYTQEELEQLYLQDYLRAQQDARENIPGFNEMTPEMQGAFTSQAFQLGGQGQADFDQMIAAIDAGDKGKAIQEVYNSDWAKQTPKRAEYLAKAIQEGSLQQAKSAVEGEMLADVEQERGRMIPTGYLNTDIFDKGGKFGSSGVPPVPQSGPQEEPTVLDQISNFFSRANEESGIGQIRKQNEEIAKRSRTPQGGRGSIVEQAGERADALRSTSVDPYMVEDMPPVLGGRGNIVEQAGERAKALDVPKGVAVPPKPTVVGESEGGEGAKVGSYTLPEWNELLNSDEAVKGDFEEIINNPQAPLELRKNAARMMQDKFGLGSGSIVTNSTIEQLLTSKEALKDNKLSQISDTGAFGQTGNVLSSKDRQQNVDDLTALEKSLSEKVAEGKTLTDDERKQLEDSRKAVASATANDSRPAIEKADELVAKAQSRNAEIYSDYNKYVESLEGTGIPPLSIEDWQKKTENELVDTTSIVESTKTPPNVKENTVASITQQTKGEKSPADNNVDPNAVVNKGEEIVKTDPEAANKVKSFLDEWGITDLFNKKEVGRMIATYLGSRALGYSHGGSLNFAAKNYVSGIEKIETTSDKLLLTDKYTPESVAEYRRTGDMALLKAKTVAPKRVSGKPQSYYTVGTNKEVKLYEYEDSNGKFLGDKDGNRINLDMLHSDAERVPTTKEFEKRSRENVKFVSSQIKGLHDKAKEDDALVLTNITPEVMSSKAGRWATINGVPVDDMGGIVEQAYRDMEAYAQRTGKQPADITPFLNQQVIRTYTSNPNLFNDSEGNPVDANKFSEVNKVISSQILKSQYKDAPASDIVNQYINAMERKWEKLSQETLDDGNPNPDYNPQLVSMFSDGANEGESGFLLYLQNDLGIGDERFKDKLNAK